MKTLSPYYLTIPRTNPDTLAVAQSLTLNIFVWSGLKTGAPLEPNYPITKVNAAGIAGNERINIAKIVNDYIDFGCEPQTTTQIVDGNNQVWVKTFVTYSDEPTSPKQISTQLATKGYGYFLEGENPILPANKILLQGDEHKISRSGLFVFPFMITETTPITPEFIITSIVGDDIFFTINFTPDEIFMRYRQTGDLIWTLAGIFNIVSPLNYAIPLSGLVEVELFAYDALTDNTIYSNIYEINQP